MKLIDKDALVAEIERQKKSCEKDGPYWCGRVNSYNDIISMFDTLEVKEVESMQENPCNGCTNRKGCITCENGELRETVQEEPKFKVGDKVIYLNEEYEIADITDHYILHTTKRTKIEVLHLAFDNEELMELVEEPVSETTTKWPFIAGNDYICIKELYHFKKGKIYHCVSNNYLIGEFGTVTPEHFNFDISDYFMKTSDSKIKFKKGDSIRDISSNKIIKITAIDCDGYFAITDNSHEVFLPIVDQNNWELVEPEQELSHQEVTKISVSEKKCMFTKDNYTDEDRKVLCEGCEAECKYSKQSVDEAMAEIEEKAKAFTKAHKGESSDEILSEMRGKVPVSDDLEKVVEEIVDPTVLNAYGVKEIANRLRRTMINSVSEELNEAAIDYAESVDYRGFPNAPWNFVQDVFKAGAKWQKEQFEKNRLKHCNSITNEQAELEQGFIDQHLDKYQRMPTFLDAIEYGMNLQKEQMMKDAINAEITYGKSLAIPSLGYKLDKKGLDYGDKVKVIIIKK